MICRFRDVEWMLNYLVSHVNFWGVLIISIHSLDRVSYIFYNLWKEQESYARLLIISGTYREELINRLADGENPLASLTSSVHSSFPYAPLNQFHHLSDDPLTAIRHFLSVLGTGLVFITLLFRPLPAPSLSDRSEGLSLDRFSNSRYLVARKWASPDDFINSDR